MLANEMNQKVYNAYGRFFLEQIKRISNLRKQEKNNLAFLIAQNLPSTIKGEVVKIIRYYE